MNEKANISGNDNYNVSNSQTFRDSTDEARFMKVLVQEQNRKGKKSGGFQVMGLSHAVFKGIMKKGYRMPTPVQRKTIPIIMDGRDVVAMARTGSGKTAAFLVPMLERLKVHSAQSGARALILSPTRELAVQTHKFVKALGRYTDLRTTIVLGGDRMEDQFTAIHQNPDIIIATPGRFLHLMIEMNLKLINIEYVVFDEADRLFELGFAEQLQEIIRRLPTSRQTTLFSATLPKLLVEFARAGLNDPVLIRLDVDHKLSENLKLAFFCVRPQDRTAAFLHLLYNVIEDGKQTLVFVATRHHAEYLKELLTAAKFNVSCVYGNLDQTARKICIGRFSSRKTSILIVTDVAARGIDIPILDNVINYNFPAQPKLFVHRVGRVARAGRCGTAFSLVANDELSYLFDLHLFLGRPVQFASTSNQDIEDNNATIGSVPQELIDFEEDFLQKVHSDISDLSSLFKVASNAYQNYIKCRPLPSNESVKRAKSIRFDEIPLHPLLKSEDIQASKLDMLKSIKNYSPIQTIFEISTVAKNAKAAEVMRMKRKCHTDIIQKRQAHTSKNELQSQISTTATNLEIADDNDTKTVFAEIVEPGKKGLRNSGDRKKLLRDKNYVPYTPGNYNSEKGLMLSSFNSEIGKSALNLLADEVKDMHNQKHELKWDRKRKRFVNTSAKEKSQKKVRTESGSRISASYKSNIYNDWIKKSKSNYHGNNHANDERNDDGLSKIIAKNRAKANKRKGKRHELKTNEEILKQRRQKQRLWDRQRQGRKRNFKKHVRGRRVDKFKS